MNARTHISVCKAASHDVPSSLLPALADWCFPAVAVYLGVWVVTAVTRDPRKDSWHTSNAIFAPLAAAYAVLLVASWDPSTLSLILPGSLKEGFSSGGLKPQFLPQLEGIQQLFTRHITAASLMVHLSCINLFAAHTILLQGGSTLWGKYCTVLCVAFGPVGILAAFLWPPAQCGNDQQDQPAISTATS
ncbi:hypothetical protein WJX84_006871 [Apatococcus fuscideae]|uniref:Uncharacterized protein n=1 Tax=Apatococcus fuscideae TaxID=2026836 RepID=A0AAW1T8L0_9CHLO